jgi:hypothetical protein
MMLLSATDRQTGTPLWNAECKRHRLGHPLRPGLRLPHLDRSRPQPIRCLPAGTPVSFALSLNSYQRRGRQPDPQHTGG